MNENPYASLQTPVEWTRFLDAHCPHEISTDVFPPPRNPAELLGEIRGVNFGEVPSWAKPKEEK